MDNDPKSTFVMSVWIQPFFLSLPFGLGFNKFIQYDVNYCDATKLNLVLHLFPSQMLKFGD